jgi:SAM-dependent methyltransferase
MGQKSLQEIMLSYVEHGDAVGWFEAVYAAAEGESSRITWADMSPNPHLVSWLEANPINGEGKRALVVGCGLGDDAERLAAQGFDVTAFDISPTAIAWSKERFPDSNVTYVNADLLNPPQEWEQAFDFVFEAYTLQALLPSVRPQAAAKVGRFVAPGGMLLLICRGREDNEDAGTTPPFRLSKSDLAPIMLTEEKCEIVDDNGTRRFRLVAVRK